MRSFFFALLSLTAVASAAPPLTLDREANWLVIRGAEIPGGELRINYLEAYCRAGSADTDWVKHTVIPHRSEMLSRSEDGTEMRLRDRLEDGVTVEHTITAGADEVTFDLVAQNPGPQRSEAHWAQPCVRLSRFTGFDEKTAANATDYLPKCFASIGRNLWGMPFDPWAKEARYVPGQVWCPAEVPRSDVNPRPLSPLVPEHGLIGCYSGDGRMLFATAWQPYQELFQGVARCLHSDFRIGGLEAGETKRIRGKIYLMRNDIRRLWERYRTDFPEQNAP